MTNAEMALDFVTEGAVLGLGSGRAAEAFVRTLGTRVRSGLRVRGIPTSQATAKLAVEVGVPLTSLDDVTAIDVTIDGADEVDPQLDLIKGYGGALVREKIVAAASRRLVILVGTEKLVPTLGARGILPVEVVPFGTALCSRRLTELGHPPTLRMRDSRPFVTDNGNHILDCAVGAIHDPAQLERDIRSLPGVVGTGLFIGMADAVLIQEGDSVQVRRRTKSGS